MSLPLGSQPQFSAGLPRPPAMLGQPPFGAGGAYPLPPLGMLPGRPQGLPLRSAPNPASPLTLNPPRDGNAVPSIMPPKQTTVYVGKISASVDDDVVRQLLEACGKVNDWKRMEDPDTKARKAFGFCEFEEADGVIRAMSLLQNLAIGGQELLLKCNTGTTRYIESVADRRAGAPASEADQPNSVETDNEALEKIMGIVSSHAQALPPPPEAVTQADDFLAKLAESEKKDSRSRDVRRGRRSSRDEDKVLESSLQREKESERKEQEARLHEEDVAYKSVLRKWEAEEMEIKKKQERDRDRERDIAKERKRQLKADLENENDKEEPWQRKLYAGSRRAADRKRWREKEQQEDEADRVKEEEERAKRAKHHEREEANGHRTREASSQREPSHAQHARLEDPNDSITQAMMTAAKAPRRQPAASSPQQSQAQEVAPAQTKPKKPLALAAFGGDEEDDQPKRTLKPLTYSEEEQKAAQRPAPPNLKEKQAAVKELIAKVPTDTTAVFKYEVDWKAYDDGSETLKERIRKWVAKKTGELLGLEEASMVDYIMTLLTEHTSAEKVLEALQEVLDEETNPFVFKLFRMVIFETLKQAANLQD